MYSTSIKKLCPRPLGLNSLPNKALAPHPATAEHIYKLAKEDKLDVLLENPAISIDSGIFTALTLASQAGNKKVAQRLIEKGANVDGRPHGVADSSPLFLACENGHTDIVELLIKNKAKLDQKNSLGITVMHVVSMKGYSEIAKLLIKNGADINLKEESLDDNLHHNNFSPFHYDNSTPLHMACEYGREEIVKILIGNDADLEAKNSWGWTALQVASRNQYNAIVKIFQTSSIEALKKQVEIEKVHNEIVLPVLFSGFISSMHSTEKTTLEYTAIKNSVLGNFADHILDSSKVFEISICPYLMPATDCNTGLNL